MSFESKLAQREILDFTEHGAEQMAARGFTQDAVLKIIKEGTVKEVAYKGSPQIHYLLGRYRIVVEISGRNAGKIISIMGDYSAKGGDGGRGIFNGF